jgi:shikimate dehydrogenase
VAASDPIDISYIAGSTRLFAIVGHPIDQVRSPEMVTAEFKRRQKDAILLPLHILPEDFDSVLPAVMKIHNLDGLVFTVPYKARACALAGELGAQARLVGAANAMARRPGGRWLADMFDGLGCVEAFRRRGFSFDKRRVMLIGAGGAGSAIGVAVAHEHPAAIRLHDIDDGRARALADKIRQVDKSIAVDIGPPAWEGMDALINASPVGMLDDRRVPVAASALPPGLMVLDAITKPEKTGLLALAEASGCPTLRGRDMMNGQISRIVDFFGY